MESWPVRMYGRLIFSPAHIPEAYDKIWYATLQWSSSESKAEQVFLCFCCYYLFLPEVKRRHPGERQKAGTGAWSGTVAMEWKTDPRRRALTASTVPCKLLTVGLQSVRPVQLCCATLLPPLLPIHNHRGKAWLLSSVAFFFSTYHLNKITSMGF